MSIRFKHAFVTGATDIVGSRLCERLSEIGARVTAYSRTASRYKQPEGVSQVHGDIRDAETLMVASQGVDVIFHLAGAVHQVSSFMNLSIVTRNDRKDPAP